MNERSGLSLMFAALIDASRARRGVKITPATSRELDSLKKDSAAKAKVQLAA